MSKALLNYINNLSKENLNITKKDIVDTIDSNHKVVYKISRLRNGDIVGFPLEIEEPKAIEDTSKEYKVTVKVYMTKPDSVNFTFHTTWNNGKAMPLRVMYGKIIDQTKNMYKMKLEGRITKTDICLKCGKPLTNEISKLYGLGPECGQHYYINPLNEEEFKKYQDSIQDKFSKISWEGWVPKLSVISMEEING